MKRSAKVLTYYYHVIFVDGIYKVKRSLFPNKEGSLFCSTQKENAERHITYLIADSIKSN